MKYEDTDFFDKYKCIHEEKIKQIIKIDKDEPCVIFLDGKNITKTHNYDFYSKNSFTKNLIIAGKNVCKKYNLKCKMYAVIDEITFVFYSSKNLEKSFGEDNYESCLVLFVQEFYKEFSKYADVLFKGVIYKTTPSNIDKIIDFRREAGKLTALEYICKDNNIKVFDKNKEELIKELIKLKKLNEYENNIDFKNGIEDSYLVERDFDSSDVDDLIDYIDNL